MTRNQAYRWLAEQTGVDRKRCHVGMMNEAEALLTVEVSLMYRNQRIGM